MSTAKTKALPKLDAIAAVKLAEQHPARELARALIARLLTENRGALAITATLLHASIETEERIEERTKTSSRGRKTGTHKPRPKGEAKGPGWISARCKNGEHCDQRPGCRSGAAGCDCECHRTTQAEKEAPHEQR